MDMWNIYDTSGGRNMKRQKIKEKTEPVFIRPNLKGFLEKSKIDLKIKNNKFYGMSETLMYYLEDSKLFRNDWLKYCGVEEGTLKILEFEGEDLLVLISKCHS